jgi:hypothetical protein
MLANEIKPNEKDIQIVDDLMDELENLGAKVKSDQPIKDENGDEHKKKKKHHRHHSPDSKHDRKKSRYNIHCNITALYKLCLNCSHKDRKRTRRSSTGSNSSNRNSSDSGNRSPSPKHHRSSKKSKNHDRNESPPRRKPSSVPDKPTTGSIYDGTVISIMQWGCFVRLDQFRTRTEGLVHISNVNI